MDRNVMIERLEWFANEGYGNEMPDWLAPNVWGKSVAELAAAALDALRENDHLFDQRWRPIDEAPIPDHDLVPIYWLFPCMIQDEAGVVYAGFARYVDTNARGRSPRVLRWYEGVSQRYAQILKPRYFQPLPQPRKD